LSKPQETESDMIRVVPNADDPRYGTLHFRGMIFDCALGKGGVTTNKVEGDHKTPLGEFPLRHLYYRTDKLSNPIHAGLPMRAILPDEGWCDDPADTAYNRPIILPYAASHENLWREDDLYDLIIELGYNDNPPTPGKGSAIFLHVATQNEDGTLKNTEGCVALRKDDLLQILPLLWADERIVIEAD